MEETKVCRVCSESAEKCCSGCRAVWYCSVGHQKSDWKNHKTSCKTYKVEINEEFGRHLVASRDLKAGTLVLNEVPLSSAPVIPGIEGDAKDAIIPVCLSCNTVMICNHESPEKRCSKCKWPVCSTSCEKASIHADNECEIFSKNKVVFDRQTNDYCMHVFVLRVSLMKHRNPTAWASLMNLRYQRTIPLPGTDADRQEAVEKLNAADIIRSLKISEYVSVDDWVRVFNLLYMNIFAANVIHQEEDSSTPRNTCVSFLALDGSLLSHSCSPNCSCGTSSAPKTALMVRTAVDVVRGEMLTICHNLEVPLVGTQARQARISHFVCKCIRCVDPTELGSQASTFVCNKCKLPCVVSTNPLDKNAPWKCESCGTIESSGLSKLKFINTMFNQVRTMPPDQIDSFIASASGTILHPNHWVLTEAARRLMKSLADGRNGIMTDSERQLYISKSQHLLKVTNLTVPGLSRERAQLQLFISRETLKKAMDDYSAKNINLVQLQQQLTFVSNMQEEAYKFFKTDGAEIRNKQKGSMATYLEEQMQLVKLLFSGKYTNNNK